MVTKLKGDYFTGRPSNKQSTGTLEVTKVGDDLVGRFREEKEKEPKEVEKTKPVDTSIKDVVANSVTQEKDQKEVEKPKPVDTSKIDVVANNVTQEKED